MILIATLLSIAAAVSVARGKALSANCVWAVTNIVIIWHNYSIGEYEMVFLFLMYEIIAIFGVYNLWGKGYVSMYRSKRRMDMIIKEYKENE